MRLWVVLLLAVSTVSLSPKTDNDPFDYSSFKTYYELNDSVQSNLKGKTVLIEFWATWCLPCRVKNGELNQTYSEFGNDHFEIISVALDTDSATWKKAIKNDRIQWSTTVMDTNKLNRPFLKKAEIYYLPNNILVDSTGTVIGRELSIDDLEKALK